MKKIALSTLIIFFGFNILSADEYSTNKRYSFQEVAEVLSEKIIEDREKIVALHNQVEELKAQLKTTENGINRKLNDVNGNISSMSESRVNKNSARETDNTGTVNNATMRNIEISSELYNKVR